ncbi:MAG: nucleotidyltransferase domain-containing protein [Oscillospiraceae bacterium]
MKETILKQLSQVEQAENIRIVFAAEPGSRAWEFTSPDKTTQNVHGRYGQ